MKLLQILLFFLTWLTAFANTTPPAQKLTITNYVVSFSTAENQKIESEVKIGIEHFARSGISENSFSQKINLRDSYVLENRARDGKVNVLQGAGNLENFLLQQAKIQESLTLLKNKNLVSKFAGASEVQASSIHRYTVSSFELNGKLNKGIALTEYETKWLQSVKEGLEAMRNSKKYVG